MRKEIIEDQISKLENQESESKPQHDFRKYQKQTVNKEVEQKQDTINRCLSNDQIIQFNPNVQFIPLKFNHHKYKIIQEIEAIVFNNLDSIMISTINKDIFVWNFDNGKLNYTSKILKGHQQNVYCLVYSKLSQWFVSGRFDKNIIIWKQLNDQQWKSTCIFNSDSEVFHFYLNKKEDQLFSTHLYGSIKIGLITDGQIIFLYTKICVNIIKKYLRQVQMKMKIKCSHVVEIKKQQYGNQIIIRNGSSNILQTRLLMIVDKKQQIQIRIHFYGFKQIKELFIDFVNKLIQNPLSLQII